MGLVTLEVMGFGLSSVRLKRPGLAYRAPEKENQIPLHVQAIM